MNPRDSFPDRDPGSGLANIELREHPSSGYDLSPQIADDYDWRSGTAAPYGRQARASIDRARKCEPSADGHLRLGGVSKSRSSSTRCSSLL